MNKLLVSLICLCLAGTVFSQGQVISCPKGTTAGWTWDGQKCEPCANSWCRCNEYNGCDSCIDGYLLDPKTKTCMKCDDPLATSCCADMTAMTAGTYGGKGYALRSEKCGLSGGANNVQTILLNSDLGNTGVCFNPGWCKSWTEYGVCTGCAAGYYLNESSTCTACPANCSMCETSDHCTQCADGFYLDFTTLDNKGSSFPICQACNEGCTCAPTVSSNIKCKACRKGWYENSAGQTDENRACASCDATKFAIDCTLTTVITCKAGYVKAGDNECKPCPTNCDNSATSNCEWKSNAAVCNKCINHYYPSADKTSCTECDSSNWNRCNPGAAADAPVITVQCGESTGNEGSYNTEAPHKDKRYLVNVTTDSKTVPTCVVNANSCKTITPKDTDNQACSACYENLQWWLTSDKKCKQCQAERGDGCKACTVDDTNLACSSCKDGYWATKDTNSKITACTLCSSSMEGCTLCSDDKTCTTCMTGYRKTDTKTCEKCTDVGGKDGGEKCAVCTANKDKCEKCMDGYTLISIGSGTPTQICELCQGSCMTCSPRNTCTSCKSGYYLKNGKCLKAISNCNAYNVSGGSCDICAQGYRKLTREDGFTICVSCHNTSLGYVNCINTCSAQGKKWPYRRDGAEYNKDAEAKRQATNPDPSGSGSGNGSASTTIVAQVAFFVCVFLALVF